MVNGTTDAGGATGEPGVQALQVTPSTSVAELLEVLRRQGISDLETLVRQLLDKVREETAEDDEAFEREFFVHDHYVMTHTGDVEQ